MKDIKPSDVRSHRHHCPRTQPPISGHSYSLIRMTSSALINRFPVELLAGIFSSCLLLDWFPRTRGGRATRTRKPWAVILTISQVCQLWRAIAFNSSALWAVFRGLNPRGFINHYILQSRQAPLSILFDSYDDLAMRRSRSYHIKHLLPALCRARNLSFQSDTAFRTVDDALRAIEDSSTMHAHEQLRCPSSMTNLRGLYVRGDGSSNHPRTLLRFDESTFMLHASLTVLSLIDVIFVGSSEDHRDYSRSLNCLLQVLASLPTLIHLTLECRKGVTRTIPIDVDDNATRPTAVLPFLRSLRILDLDVMIIPFMKSLALPRGVTMDLIIVPAFNRLSIPDHPVRFAWIIGSRGTHDFLNSLCRWHCAPPALVDSVTGAANFTRLAITPTLNAKECEHEASHMMYCVALSDATASDQRLTVELRLPDIDSESRPSSPMLSFMPPLDAVRHFSVCWPLTEDDWLSLAASTSAVECLTVTDDALSGFRDALVHQGASLFPRIHRLSFVFRGERDIQALQHRWHEMCAHVVECLGVLGGISWEVWTEKTKKCPEWDARRLKEDIEGLM
ncbi:hypothetical protein PENSPDRAFT_237042 [Peniophora sp. CONT]|nr:hypothetical protein PENSPDRAFT_237042 [Peniophora sp. CONT]